MKKLVSFSVFLVLVVMMAIQPAQTGLAQAAATPTATVSPEEADYVSFAAAEEIDTTLHGPYDTQNIQFGTPVTWQFGEGSVLRLFVNASFMTAPDVPAYFGETIGAALEVTLNNQLLGTVLLQNGEKMYELAVPARALVPTRSDGRHDLELFLDATVDCLFERSTTVLVRSSSGLTLPHTVISPPMDLTKLPMQIFQEGNIAPASTYIVVPDDPEAQELQAAMTVASGFGRMTAGQGTFELVNQGSLQESITSTANLIVVGKPAGFPFLGSVSFPFAVNANGIQASDLGESDGIVQIGVSPWNPESVVVYVGGSDVIGVNKAAQAFSSGALRVGRNKALTIVTSVNEAVEMPEVATDRTLANLGYPTLTMSGVGYRTLDYNLLIPLGQVPGPDAYFDFIFSHSALLDFNLSGAVVYLNDQTIGSVRFTEETSKEITSLRISIPQSNLHSGNNILSIQAEFLPTDFCSVLNRDGLWMTVHENSLLHVPLIPADNEVGYKSPEFSSYPVPFNNNPALSGLTFALPRSDALSWNISAHIAANYGNQAAGSILMPGAVYADDIPEEIRQNNNLVLVGRASQLPVIQELTDAMPAPFDAGSDMANESGFQVTYQFPEGTDIGYLEIFSAPWNPTHTVLAVLGSTPTGLQMSGNVLLDNKLTAKLNGNLAVVNGTQILSAYNDPALGMSLVPDEAGTDIAEIIPVGPSQPAFSKENILTASIVTSGLIILVVVVAIFASRRKEGSGRSTAGKHKDDTEALG